VGDDEYCPAQQIVDRAIINAVTRDHLISAAGNGCDLRRDRKAGIFRTTARRNFVLSKQTLLRATSPKVEIYNGPRSLSSTVENNPAECSSCAPSSML
jgi:hypothetical protein